MCGIAGWIGTAAVRDGDATARAMAAAIAHRGPDGSGVAPISAGQRASGYLAHRRLAVIDLSDRADQPMTTRDGGPTLVFNGEIYNFVELRRALEDCGVSFRSSGDTEVVLRAYEQWGPGFVSRLDGMFALAIWDPMESRLLLARDRTGKKPLFWTLAGGRMTFSSEIKGLSAAPWVRLEPDRDRLPEFLTFGCVDAPRTFYREIQQLPPATTLLFHPADARIAEERWWSPMPHGPARRVDGAFEAELRDALDKAVERRMVADVPVGALLSGGIDSSLITALMVRHAPGRVRTFSAGLVDEPTYDERSFARTVADRLGTDHTEFAVRTDAAALLDRLVWLHDGPFGDSSAIPTYLVCQAARSEVTVVLTGDGGDEVFGGYERFTAAALSRLLGPRAVGLAQALVRHLPAGDGSYHDSRARLTRFLSAAQEPLPRRYLRWVSVFPPERVSELTGSRDGGDPLLARIAEAQGLPEVDRILYANFCTYLPDDLHVKVDRMSMAHGLEARSPLLDTSVIDLLAPVRARDKVGLRYPKPILRRTFRSLVPDEIWHRRKHGFGVPMDVWFDGELGVLYADEVLSRDGRLRTWIGADQLQSLFDGHRAGVRAGPQLWTLLTLERWLRAVERPGALAEPAEPALDGASR